MRSQTRPAADEIGMRCKPLFYFSRRSLVFGRWQRHVLSSRAESRDLVFILTNDQRLTANDRPYPGLSRCTTFTRYPAVRNRFETSSAIMTDRCCPPVQPKEIVR
jgi:hypothetical protein